MPRAIFDPLRTIVTFKEKTVELLTRAIISGKIKPGERLNESQLAGEFRVSRSPVREALQELQHQGLVVSGHRRGLFVVSLDPEDIQKINSLRVILEGEALRLTRERTTPQLSKKLAEALKRLEDLVDADPNDQTHGDLVFHQTIWAASGNQYLEKILNELTAPLMAHAMLRRPHAHARRAVLNSHRPLLDFIIGDPTQSAEEVMAAHISLPWADSGRSPNADAKTSKGRTNGTRLLKGVNRGTRIGDQKQGDQHY